MKKIYKNRYILFVCLFAFLCSQCEKSMENPKYVPPIPPTITHPNDIYLYENNGRSLLEKYNLAVRWRWNDNMIEDGDRATPVKSDFVIPVTKVLEYMWLGVFEAVGQSGKDFVKEMIPARLKYIGSYIYKDNKRTLGFAESGASIALLNLNSYRLNSRRWLTNPSGGILATIHHEHGHIVHQKHNLPIGFNKISEKYLGNGWLNEKDINNVIKLGMVRNYATKDEYDDFCEIVSHYLVMPKAEFEKKFITHEDRKSFLQSFRFNYCEREKLKACETSKDSEQCKKDCDDLSEINAGRAKIKQKLDLVITFYKEKFDINLTQVRDTLQTRINYVVKHNKIPTP